MRWDLIHSLWRELRVGDYIGGDYAGIRESKQTENETIEETKSEYNACTGWHCIYCDSAFDSINQYGG